MPVVPVVVAFLLVAVTVHAARRTLAGSPSVVASLTLVGLGLVWQQLDQSFEGAILWTVTPSHGLVLADLVALPALALVTVHALSVTFVAPVRRTR